MEAQLGSNAPRELVAEILFRALLTEMVDYTVLNGYVKNGKTLGYEQFKLEEIEGVVVANEYADLNSSQVLPEGKTEIQVAGEEKVRRLDITSTLEDIGESRYAYTQNVSKVLALGDTGKNTTKENDGAALEIDTTAKFNAAAGMPAAADIEYYVNFDRVGTYTCDQRLEFSVTFAGWTAERSFQGYAHNVNISRLAAEENRDGTTDNDWTVEVVNLNTGAVVANLTATLGANDTDYATLAGYAAAYATAGQGIRYNKIIRAGHDITDEDLDVIFGIFGAADNVQNNGLAKDAIEGDVFVGTYSTQVNPEDRDLSNKISFNTFFDTYIKDITYDINWVSAVNGEWVKFIDNDGDGQCEYAFCTMSFLDEAIDTYKRGETTVTQFNWFDDNDDPRAVNGDYQVRYMNGEVPAVGDKVIACLIDNQYLVEPANNATKTVTDYSWRDDQIKTTDGDTYGQSGILNATDMQQFLSTMSDGTEYIMYFDHFGYVRAYELPGGKQYALITEIYASNNNNGNLIQNWPMTVELKAGEAAVAEYNLSGGSSSPFVSGYAWTMVGSYANNSSYNNYLQPAIAHLGVGTNGFGPVTSTPNTATPTQNVSFRTLTSSNTSNYSFWNRNRQIVKVINTLGAASEEFNYGSYVFNRTEEIKNVGTGTSAATVSFTNVAVTNINGETATLTGAAQLRRDQAGNILVRPGTDTNNNGIVDRAGELARYAVDYVQLTKDNTVSGQTRYNIDPSYNGWQGSRNNNYVSATHDTEYYIVYNGGVYYFTDYTKMPKLTMEDNNIHAAYAVARDTSADNANAPYWVADVIVYEVENWNDSARTSVALIYDNPSRNNNQVQLLNGLDNKNDPTDTGIVPSLREGSTSMSWGADRGRFDNYSGYGFYHMWDGTKQEDGNLAVSNIELIDGKDHRDFGDSDLRWNSNLIYAGVVINEVDVATRGTYLNVDTDNDGTTNVSLLIADSSASNVYSITENNNLGSRWGYNQAGQLRYTNVRTSEIKAGDRIIWVGNSSIDVKDSNTTQTAAFVVDMGNDITNVSNPNANAVLRDNTADFLVSYNTLGQALPVPAGPVGTGYPTAGLWNMILSEQMNTTKPAGNTVTVTYKYDLDSSVTAAADKLAWADLGKTSQKIPANKGVATTFASTDTPIAIPGWTVADIAVTRTNNPSDTSGIGVHSSSSVAANATAMSEDITVTVKYARVANTVAVTLATMGTPAPTVSYSIPTATTATGTFTATATIGAGMDWAGDGTLTWTAAPHTTYAISATANATFTLSNVGTTYTLTIDDVKGAATVTITGTDEAGITITAPTTDAIVTGATIYQTNGAAVPAKWYAGDKFGVGLTVAAGNVVDRVYWMENGSTAQHEMTQAAAIPSTTPGTVTETTGFWTSDDAINAGNVTVYVVTHPTTVVVTVAVDASYTGTWQAAGTGTATITSAGALAAMPYEGDVTISGNANMWVKVTTGDATSTGTISGNASPNVTIPDVTAAVTVTIYGTQTAYET